MAPANHCGTVFASENAQMNKFFGGLVI